MSNTNLTFKKVDILQLNIVIILLFYISLLQNNSFAQNNMGVGTLNPDPSSILDLSSSDKGLLIPRIMDTNNVSSPATGLLIYLTSANNFYYFNSWHMFK